MQNHVYADYPKLEETHWWYAARRRFINRLLNMFMRKGHKRWLDAGCGTGGNLRSLDGPVTRLGIDFSPTALLEGLSAYQDQDQHDQKKIKWVCGDVSSIAMQNHCVDVITCLDVLEHLPDDYKAVSEFHRILSAEGLAVLTVPAHRWLWSDLDRIALHHRRYSSKEFHDLIRSVDWEIVEWGSYNSLLFPMVAMVRMAQKLAGKILPLRKKDGAPGWIVGPSLGKVFHSIFVLEHKLSKWIPKGFGVSLYAVCRKRIQVQKSSSILKSPPASAKSSASDLVPIKLY